MKAVCVLAGVPVMQEMAETIVEAAHILGAEDVVCGDWLDGQVDEFSNLVLKLEKEGPSSFPIPQVIAENLDADILIGAFCPFSFEMMDRMPNLKTICVCRGGIENVDLDAATAHGIKVVNAAGRNANAVSDFTVGMMLACIRDLAQSNYYIRTGRADQALANAGNNPDMEGKTVGLVGLGHIGRLVAKKLGGFDVNIVAYDPFVKQEDLEGTGIELVEKDELFQRADIVSVHARLSEDTFHMIGERELSLMKETAFFVNTARAGLVDYDALYAALRDRKISGAALDVFYEEPVPSDSPWLELQNVVLTGHLGGVTVDAQRKSPIIAAKKVVQFEETKNARLLMNPSVVE